MICLFTAGADDVEDVWHVDCIQSSPRAAVGRSDHDFQADSFARLIALKLNQMTISMPRAGIPSLMANIHAIETCTVGSECLKLALQPRRGMDWKVHAQAMGSSVVTLPPLDFHST